ncbi:MAG TPA: RNA polymerase sigma factor [Gemmatimonadaceae bacterium]|nr:RNA polymerase sigma factor [Gemmatimonadaceae bacterium]
METRSDADLIAQVLAGHSDAYAILVDRHRDRCYRFAVRLLGDRDDADEAIQSAFVRAFRGLAGCRNRDHLSAWLLQIVRNECRTIAGRRAKRAQRFVRDDDELNKAPIEQPAETTAMLEEIQFALDKIELDQREAFLLKYVEELSYDEMSSLTGASVPALKMRVSRACAQLRKLLKREGIHS